MAMRSRSANPRGFTAVELLVLLGIVLVLLSIFIPYLLRAREMDRRTRCLNNLAKIGIALNTYASANWGYYPRVVYDPAKRPTGYVAFTGPDAANPFARDSAVAASDATASLWLLVRGGYIGEKDRPVAADFICPSSRQWADPMTDSAGKPVAAHQRSNFRSGRHLSYSYCSPYTNAPWFRLSSDYLKTTLFVLMADRNPGIGGGSDVTAPPRNAPPLELARANSRNHGRAGQNVLYLGGHGAFITTPYGGIEGDNIYTALAAGPFTDRKPPKLDANGVCGPQYGPSWTTDSYLVPTEQENSAADFAAMLKPPPPAPSQPVTQSTQAATQPTGP